MGEYFYKANARQHLIRLDEWMQARLRMHLETMESGEDADKQSAKVGASKQKAYEWGNKKGLLAHSAQPNPPKYDHQ
ncbi:MAG: hypothetical protein IPH31_14525 [Lewinellaceae bacterium]|nr:hypothetical protein [Lewinellaceae bacterium]